MYINNSKFVVATTNIPSGVIFPGFFVYQVQISEQKYKKNMNAINDNHYFHLEGDETSSDRIQIDFLNKNVITLKATNGFNYRSS